MPPNDPTPNDGDPGEGGSNDQTFTQADVDRIVSDRLARERKKAPSNLDELTAKAAKYDELEESQKSEVQKATDAQQAAEARAAAAESRAMRMEIAAEKGLDLGLASRLVGDDREAMEQDADQLLERIGPGPNNDGSGTPPPARKPAQNLKGGSTATETEEVDVADIVESIPRSI